MAGLSINYIREKLETNNPVARIMPNTNAQVGHSVTGISFSGNFDPHSKDEVTELVVLLAQLLKLTKNIYIKVTAITGSGPAFISCI